MNVQDYYGLPLLKPPVWTWEIPAYFLVGGTSGAAAVVGAVARATGASSALVTHARWIAAAGAAASPALLISDLGRPGRFLNMLRVVKLQSPMSVGAWTLVVFSSAAGAAAVADAAAHRTGQRTIRVAGHAAEAVAAASGLVLATYTGVLIGATSVPVWARSAGLLPVHFGASGLGAAVSLLEVLGHRERALARIAVGAAAVETAVGIALETGEDEVLEPVKSGWSGSVVRTGVVLSGPVPAALRLLAGRSPRARQLAACSTLIGAALTRVGWMAAGRRSAQTNHGAQGYSADSIER